MPPTWQLDGLKLIGSVRISKPRETILADPGAAEAAKMEVLAGDPGQMISSHFQSPTNSVIRAKVSDLRQVRPRYLRLTFHKSNNARMLRGCDELIGKESVQFRRLMRDNGPDIGH